MDWKIPLIGLAIGFGMSVPVGPVGLLVFRRSLLHHVRAGIVTGLAPATDGLPADIGVMPTGGVPTAGRGAASEAVLPTVAGRSVAGAVAVGDAGLSLPKSEPNQSPTCLPAFITQPTLPAIQSMA